MSSDLTTEFLDEPLTLPDHVRRDAARFLRDRDADDIAAMLGLGDA